MRQFALSIIVAFILLSSLAESINYSNYHFIHVSSYLGFAFGISLIFISVFSIISPEKYRPKQIKVNILDLLVIAWFIYYFISFYFSSKFNFLYDNALIQIACFGLYFIIRWFIGFENREKVKYIFYVLIIVGCVEAIHCYIQILGLFSNIIFYKYGGAFGNPGDLANFLTLTYAITIGMFFFENSKKLKLLLFSLALLQISIIIISFARTAWISCTISSFLIFFYFRFKLIFKTTVKKFRKNLFTWSLILIAVLFVCFYGIYKLYLLKSDSADGRIFMYKLSSELVFEKPIFGHGYYSYYSVQHQKQIEYFKLHPNDTQNGWYAGEVAYAFNDFLQLTVEYGLAFLFLFLFLLWTIFSFKGSTVGKDHILLLVIGRIAIISILICMLFSYPLQNPTILLCFFSILASISAFDNKIFLNFVIEKKIKLATILVFASLAILLSISSLRTIQYGLKWKKSISYLENDPKECVKQYNSIKEVLLHNISFVQNYGSILYSAGEHNKCIEHYQKFQYLCLRTDILLKLGESYENIGNYAKAEEYYLKSSYIVPHKFIPKYKLFKLYQLTNQNDKANQMAMEIRKKRIKVYSETVSKIKIEVNEYLAKLNLKE